MYKYNKSVLSPYDPTKLAIRSLLHPEDDLISNCGPNVKKTVSFDDVVNFIDEENMVTHVHFDCGTTFLPETPTKIRQFNRERKYISRSCREPQCFPRNNQHTCSVDEHQNSNIFVKPYNSWDMVQPALIPLNQTNHLLSMVNQYPQPIFQQHRTDPTPVFSSLRSMDCKRRGLRVSLAFFQRNY